MILFFITIYYVWYCFDWYLSGRLSDDAVIEKDDENLKACESFHNKKVFNVVGPVCESADFLAKVILL